MKRVASFVLTFLLVSILIAVSQVSPAKASGTIYIRADGSVDPSWAPIARNGSVYTFTGNINDSIVIERSNIIVDGNGYTLLGSGSLTGLYIRSGVNNVTVRDITITNFMYGIFAYGSSFNTFSGNCLTANTYHGIYLYNSSNNSIPGNNITANARHGIYGYSAFNNNISGNTVTTNGWFGISLGDSSGNSASGNNVTANNQYGIFLINSFNNSVSGNTVAANWFGVTLDSSFSNSVSGNTVTANTYHGVVLGDA
ncbi:MAG: right-handed parallel beta-helix repeat-containing protein, partial [Candidatus Bathyarchaeia archaeon]